MSDYSILRVGNEYIVQVGNESILRLSSRRRAVKLVTLAADLLDQETLPVRNHPSIGCDPDVGPGETELP